MTVIRAQCSFLMDTDFPRDRLVINPCFEMTGTFQDADAIAEDLATALDGWTLNAQEVRVKTYDVQGTKPVYPNGEAVRNAGIKGTSTVPRELALCLSFYAERNVPRQRGRLYVPFCLATTGSTVSREPSAAQQDNISNLVDIFEALGGVDVDWVVWSQRDQQARKVTNWWVDNEWDIQRSRGLRATSRLTGTTTG